MGNLIGWLLAVSLISGAGQEVVLDGEPILVRLVPGEPGAAPSWSCECTIGFKGHLYASALAPEQALSVQLTHDGKSGEKREVAGVAALVKALVAPGQVIAIQIVAPDAEGEVTARVRLASSIETEVVLTAAEKVSGTLSEAIRIHGAGEAGEARARLNAAVEELLSAPDARDSMAVARALVDVASVAKRVGDLDLAHSSLEGALRFGEQRFPESNLWLLSAKMNYAIVVMRQDRLAEARAIIEECLTVFSRLHPDDHHLVQRVRANLGSVVHRLGELELARELFQKIVDAWSAKLPEDHIDLVKARESLGGVLNDLGDLAGARALVEQALQIYERTLPEGDKQIRKARHTLADILRRLGDLEAARELQEMVLAGDLRDLPPDHPHVQLSQQNLGLTLRALGEFEAAGALERQVLEACERRFSEYHPDLQSARNNHAETLCLLGRSEEALPLFERVLAVRLESLPKHNPRRIVSRINHVLCLARLGRREQVALAASDLAHTARELIRDAARTRSPREAEFRAASLGLAVDVVLSVSADMGLFEPIRELDTVAFELVETVRGAGLQSARVLAASRNDPELADLRRHARQAAEDVVRRADEGSSDEKYMQAVLARDATQRDLLERLESSLAASAPRAVAPTVLARRLPAGTAAVGFWRYDRADFDVDNPLEERRTPSFLAYVLRPGRPLARIELGDASQIEDAVASWRESALRTRPRLDDRGRPVTGSALPAQSAEHAGERLRELVLDPLLPSLEGVSSVVVAFDHVLHGIVLDALPSKDGLVGEGMQVLPRSTLWEMVVEDSAVSSEQLLLAAGGIDYGARPAPSFERTSSAGALASTLRSGPAGAFVALPHTFPEVQRIAELAEDGGRAVLLLSGADATREALLELGPRARWLHLATHGYFASGFGPDPGTGVQGISPMVLCGLALAGANGEPDALGRVRGVVTAEELATFDFSACELAVLSACETHVGVQRAGQGLASLQKALHMAGARSVLTSLWPVGDEATAELMVGFYRRLWVERRPKHWALWEAKMALRDEGRPLRDWAGWVLTGSPE